MQSVRTRKSDHSKVAFSLVFLAQPLYIFDRFALSLENVCKGLGSYGDGAMHKFGNVVALHELTVVVGIGLWQLKGLRGLAVLANMGEERTGIGSVVTAATENHPTPIDDQE